MREHRFEGLLPRASALRAEAGAGAAPRASRTEAANVIRREGQYWTVDFDGGSVRLRDTKGLRYLACLVLHPGVEVHALELADERDASADEGAAPASGALESLDARARRELRARERRARGSA